MHSITRCFFGVTTLLATACAEPEIAPPVGEREDRMSCEELETEWRAAKAMEKAARADDRAKASYLLIVPAYVSWYRMVEAEEAAQERQVQLRARIKEKDCSEVKEVSPPDGNKDK